MGVHPKMGHWVMGHWVMESRIQKKKFDPKPIFMSFEALFMMKRISGELITVDLPSLTWSFGPSGSRGDVGDLDPNFFFSTWNPF